MERAYRQPSRLLQPLLLSIILALVVPADALYFYMEGTTPKCFYEELPKDTLVVGHYKAEHFDTAMNTFTSHPDIGIFISVDEVFDNDHRVVAQKGSSAGRFTFSAADSGDHKICFTPLAASTGGWLSSGQPVGGIKLTLDMAIGETSAIESTDKGKIMDLVQRVKDLNGRLQDIRREQVFQREREAEFRDQSESTNARVVRWTLVQLLVLGVTCAWQLSHLRAFFIKQKLT
ncbi:MAG: ERP1 precursor [Lasallia pustulata]|uniref:ERP1 n=1 Tax=Lasallia pustulata TaxID=136370 RepID=A0A5M8PMV1_9LECA|nr:MAG: ERP1 precursor [Lasallia pustulata]